MPCSTVGVPRKNTSSTTSMQSRLSPSEAVDGGGSEREGESWSSGLACLLETGRAEQSVHREAAATETAPEDILAGLPGANIGCLRVF